MSGVPESNWLPYLGKVVYYRCTNPANKFNFTFYSNNKATVSSIAK